MTTKEIIPVIKSLFTKKTIGPDCFTGKFYPTFKEEITSFLHKIFQKIEEERILPNYSMRVAEL